MTKIEILWKFQGKVNPRLRLWKEYINFVCKKLKIKFDYMFFTKVWPSALYGIKYARDVDESQFGRVRAVNEWDFWKDMD